MKLTDVIAYCDRIKPNAFTDEDKARWLSEVEGLVCTEVFLLHPGEFRPYVLAAEHTAQGMCFPEADTIRLTTPIPDEFSVGGLITLTVDQTYHSSLYAGNSGEEQHRIRAISADGCEIVLDADFSDTGRDEDPASWLLTFDGTGIELMVRPPHDKIYAAYLCAQVDFANGEYNKYQNSVQMFNGYWGEFCRWFSRNFRPADRDPARTGAYLSDYALAVKHGFVGSEEDWLRSLHGADGSSGVWISDDLNDWPDPDRHLWILRQDETGEEITVPDGLALQDNRLALMDGSEQVGQAIPLSVGLPAVTAADNGALLGVVNGAWAKTVITEWNGGSF